MAEDVVWSSLVRGGRGRFERAVLAVDEESGDFVLTTRSESPGSADRAVLARGEVRELAVALADHFGLGGA